MQELRTGAAYREALRDGRRVWIAGQGMTEDVATHPATRAVVDEHVAWYDRHFDPTWQDTMLSPPGEKRSRVPWGCVLPRSPDDLVGMGRSFSANAFLSAGNITHTPAYGQLIALEILSAVQDRSASAQQSANAQAYRQHIADTGRFLTFCSGSATIGYRMRESQQDRQALRQVRETDSGLIVSGKVTMHTSPAYAEDVYIGALNGIEYQGHLASFAVAVNQPGVTVICRKPSVCDPNPFVAPLSHRYDELDGQIWLDNVLIPWNRVFLFDRSSDLTPRWLFWHQLHCWLSKAEFTLGLAFACTHAMGLMRNEATIACLLDLMTDVQTVRACLTAAERDPQFTAAGYCYPNLCHVAAGSIAMLKARPRMGEILRSLPGSSLLVAPTDKDLSTPEIAAGLDESFRGGGYTAIQRSALLQLAWDHVSSALDARESTFELHANGGISAWRNRLRRAFDRYDGLANDVLLQLNLPMPEIDLSCIRAAPMAPSRMVDVERAKPDRN